MEDIRSLFPQLPLQKFTFSSVTLNDTGEIVQAEDRQAFRLVETLPGGVTLPLIALPGGTFQMGSLPRQAGGDEKPRHLVSLPPFLIAQSLVNQQQWQAVIGHLPPCRFLGPDLPVERVSWKQARAFCQALTKKTARDWRLPSEAQWEYACRAGTVTPFSTGETITTAYANYCGEHIFRNEPRGAYRHTSTPAGTYPANPFGLYDMHGNLWEFCADRWHPDYSGAPFDGTPWEQGGEDRYRVARGGSWHEPPGNCRSATRLRVAEDEEDDLLGFRIVILL